MPTYRNYEIQDEDYNLLIQLDQFLDSLEKMKSLAHQQREIILNRYKIFVLLEYNDKGIPSQIGRNWSFDFLFDQARNMLIEKYGEEGLFVNSQQLWHKKSPLFYSANVDYMVMSESAFLEGRL